MKQMPKLEQSTLVFSNLNQSTRINHFGCAPIFIYFQIRHLGTMSKYFIVVQFSCIQATDFLTAIAEPLSRPQFIHEYYITDSSLYGAVSIGLETEAIIKKLDSLSKVRLTTDMINHIRRKTETFGKVKLVLRNNRYRISSVESIVPLTAGGSEKREDQTSFASI